MKKVSREVSGSPKPDSLKDSDKKPGQLSSTELHRTLITGQNPRKYEEPKSSPAKPESSNSGLPDTKRSDSGKIGDKPSKKKDPSMLEARTVSSRIRRYFTGTGVEFDLYDVSEQLPPARTLEKEKQWIESLEYTGKVKIVELPTNTYNGFRYALMGKEKGFLTWQGAHSLLDSNFGCIDKKDRQARDRVVCRALSGKPTYIGVLVKDTSGGGLKVWGQMNLSGAVVEHSLDFVEKVKGDWEIYREKPGAFVKPVLDCLIRKEDHITTKGRRIPVLGAKKDAVAPPLGDNTAQIRRDGKAGEGEAMIRKA